jgi:hypothetical protein
MAMKKSTLATRARRDRYASPAAPTFNVDALHEHIEDERRRLMDAEAVLDCVMMALEEDERMNASGPCYSSVIRIACRFVRTSIHQLDSVNIKAALGPSRLTEVALDEHNGSATAPAERKHDGVKESSPLYVH